MKKICIIRQPAGLGDILHLFKVAVKLLEQKKVSEVIWPVYSGPNYIGDYTLLFRACQAIIPNNLFLAYA